MAARFPLGRVLGVLSAVAASCASPTGLRVQPFEPSPLSFTACPASLGGEGVQCARVSVPARWDASSDEQLTLLLRRLPSAAPARGQVWALDGGPGFAGDVFLDPAFAHRITDAGLDLYVPSHRGSRDESTLHCPEEQALDSDSSGFISPSEWPSCVQSLQRTWGTTLVHFNSTEAAQDVSHLMDRTESGGSVLVFGGSYGSLWGQRLLQQRPSGLDGVFLDSIVDFESSLERTDQNTDAAMRALLERCGQAPSCAGRFQGDPLASAETALAAFSRGEGCGQEAGVLRRDAVQKLMARLLSGAPFHWVVATAAYARLARCEGRDQQALEHAVAHSNAPPDVSVTGGPAYSPALNRQVIYRELYRFEEVESLLEDEQPTLLASTGGNRPVAETSRAFGAEWRAPGSFEVPPTATPLFLLSGALDPLDPPAWAAAAHARWQGSSLISVPWAGHSVLRYLGLGDGEIGSELLGDFLHGRALEGSRVQALEGPDFDAATPEVQEAAQTWFGTALF